MVHAGIALNSVEFAFLLILTTVLSVPLIISIITLVAAVHAQLEDMLT
jgi:hypothetical protein